MKSLFTLPRAARAGIGTFAVLLATASTPAQQDGHLPANRTVEFASAIGRAQIASALRTGLNSPGDEIALYIEGDLSLGVGLNGGAGAGIEALVRRLDSGGVEVVVDHSVTLSLGIEAYQDLECNATMSSSRAVLFHWPTAGEAARGLDLLAGGHQTALAALGGSIVNVFDTLRHAHGALREAITETAAAQELYRIQSGLYRSAAAKLRSVQRDVAKARRNLHKAQSRVRAAQRRVKRLPRFLRGAARRVLRAVSRLMSRNGFFYRATKVALHAAEQAAETSRYLVLQRQARLDRAYADEDSARKMVESAEAAAGNVAEMFHALISAVDELSRHLNGVEFTLSGGAEVSAAVGPAGISLENMGAGLSVESAMGGRVTYRIVDPGVESIAVALFYDVEAAAWAGFGVGVRTEVGSGIEIEADWHRAPSRGGYAFQDLTSSIHVDVAVMAVAGAGVALRHGVGQSVTLSLNASQWQQVGRVLASLDGLGAQDLAFALNGVHCDVESTQRWITQVVAGVGGSVAGTGANLSLGATWDDHGPVLAETLSASEIVRRILSVAWQQGTSSSLAARL